MKREDLLALFGNVDIKHIIHAEEHAQKKAEKNNSQHDTCESDEVGIMDNKRYIRKKIEPIIAVAATVILCVGVLIFITMRNDKDNLAENSDNASSSVSESTSAPYDEIIVAEIIPDYHPLDWCGNSYEYETQDEAVSKYFSSMLADGDTERINALQTLDSGERGMYAFSIYNLPEGFEVSRVYETSGITYSKGISDDSDEFAKAEKINFRARIDNDDSGVSGYNDYWSADGKNINKISNKTDVYYVDYDADNYQVYWAENGYFFAITFPKSVGTIDSQTHKYSGEDIFEIKKTFYVFDETNVTED